MSLPTAWVEKIFHKLTVAYGTEFLNRWKGIPITDVKSDWADCLSGYQQNPKAIAFALENLPDSKPPTAQEFRELCRRTPASVAPKLPEPKADPARVAAELAKLAPVRQAAHAGGVDHKAWARRILARHEAGQKINPTSLRLANEALRTHLAPKAEA
jgi:hypothetical protein